MRDLAKAFLVIREHAEKWLVDAEKIILCGFSAGAHNCAMYAVYWHTPIIHEFFGKEPEAFKPAAAILAYGLYDYHLMMRERADPLARAISEAANIAFFGAKSPTKEMLDAASPALHVSRHTPPIFFGRLQQMSWCLLKTPPAWRMHLPRRAHPLRFIFSRKEGMA